DDVLPAARQRREQANTRNGLRGEYEPQVGWLGDEREIEGAGDRRLRALRVDEVRRRRQLQRDAGTGRAGQLGADALRGEIEVRGGVGEQRDVDEIGLRVHLGVDQLRYVRALPGHDDEDRIVRRRCLARRGANQLGRRDLEYLILAVHAHRDGFRTHAAREDRRRVLEQPESIELAGGRRLEGERVEVARLLERRC